MDTYLTYTDTASTITNTVERWARQIMAWSEVKRAPHKVYWKRQQKKALNYMDIPDGNIFNSPFRKHRFKIGRSKK